ncbi:adenylate/guanylate cyclase domain-containing protein [Thermodesulfobacteriota bacterium]
MTDLSKSKVLVVDDTKINIDLLVETLGDDYDVSVAMDGESALESVKDDLPDLILLDIMMPGIDGYEVCRRLKADDKTKDIPVIFFTALGEVGDETRGFELGAADYIAKPISPTIVQARVRSILSLKEKTDQLATLSSELSKYLSPQVYESIFSGERRATIESQRKKLSIFFSDIVGFTQTTEKMEPEDLSNLLNVYLEEMSKIAINYGGTIDKFVGDAIMIFFGDPVSKGVKEDALASVSMALEMIDRLRVLQQDWYLKGITSPFKIRAGINTGYCTVGNFGSKTKMDYTIIGSQVNAASRLESIAEPGQVIISHETWSHIREQIFCIRKKPVTVRGVPNPIQTYQVVGFHDQIRKDDYTVPIEAIIEQTKTIQTETLVEELQLGRRSNDTFDAIVVVQEDEPVGLVMNYHVTRLLSSQSNRARFFKQPVTTVMDASPLIVEGDTPLEKIAQLAMSREPSKIYDHVIVTKEGLFNGTVTVQNILEKMVTLYEAGSIRF